ncbi:MAG: methyltransferase protein [candidate division NC10 bacterium]|nr:methyltransferase protein [candidate division NC10 bacterium]
MADGGNSGEVVERLQDPWHQVDASGEADRLIQVLEEADLAPGWAELRQTWLDYSGVRPGDRVLDVGCGTGVVTRDLAQRVGHQGQVVGIDPSTRLIQEALRRMEEKGVKGRIEFRCADVAALPFPDGSFDLVVASAVFGHIPNGPEVLAEMVRVARLAGTVVAFDHDIDMIVINAADRDLTRRIIHAYCDRYFTSGWAGRELYATFREAALEEIQVLPLMHTSTQFEPYWKRMVERLSTVAVKTGVVSEQEAGVWRGDLERKGHEGRFFASRSYFCLRGRTPAAAR